jgi:membrane associated rhomboid family serine protease
MIPLRDHNPRQTVPIVTYVLIALNILGFLWELSLGENLERALFSVAFIPARFWFYALYGILATLAHAFFSPASRIPAIGASGAIAGVLGAYLILYPHARVTTIIPIFFFVTIREIPAVIILGLWFILQLLSGVGSLGVQDAQDMGGVAFFAHIGGFVAGMLLVFLLGGTRQPRRKQPPPRWWAESR